VIELRLHSLYLIPMVRSNCLILNISTHWLSIKQIKREDHLKVTLCASETGGIGSTEA